MGDAISLDDVTDGTIGGDIAVERNVVVGSGNVGLSVIGGSTGHELLDNFFGTDINGVPIGGQTEAIDVSDGSVFVNGTIDAAEGVTVAATGILGGIGTIDGDVVNNGIVAPGNSPGVLTTGSFTFADNSTYEAELGGDTPGNNANNHDQIDVMGTVTIGNNVTLSAINFNSYAPSSGDQLVIINNDGSDPVSGTFAGLPEGAFVVDDALNNYVITYVGGDGNDVVLNATGGATFTVINTNDSGAGSLRQAILDANASAGPDAIKFDITSTEGAGPHTIAPVTLLPAITDAVIVNGLTETSASANTLPVGSDSVLQVVLEGTQLDGTGGFAFDVQAADVEIRGLRLQDWGDEFSGGAIFTNDAADNLVVAGNHIGNDGDVRFGRFGVYVVGDNATIGGDSVGDRNTISANDSGIVIAGGSGTVVSGNYIGLTPDGTTGLQNGSDGVWIASAASNVTIGGTTDAQRNVISGNNSHGVFVDGASGVSVIGNYVGTDAGEHWTAATPHTVFRFLMLQALT